MDKVSVIVPVYNAQKHLGECLESIIGQTYENIEILCINDGSIDDSINILKEYEKKDARIFVLNKENTGVSKTRNIGINKAKGKYVMFVDADDKIDKTTIKRMMENICENKSDMVICSNNLINKNGKEREINIKTKYREFDNIKLKEQQKCFEYLYDLGLGIPIWNKLIRKQFLLDNQIIFNENLTYDEDMFFSWICTLYAEKINIIDEPLYKYRLTLNSSIMKEHEDLFEKYQKEFLKIIKIMEKQKFDKEYIDFIINKIFQEKIKISIFMVLKSDKNFKEKRENIEYIINNSTSNIKLTNSDFLSRIYEKGVCKNNIYLLKIWSIILDYRNKVARLIK